MTFKIEKETVKEKKVIEVEKTTKKYTLDLTAEQVVSLLHVLGTVGGASKLRSGLDGIWGDMYAKLGETVTKPYMESHRDAFTENRGSLYVQSSYDQKYETLVEIVKNS